jgi:hypothetical protein
MCRGFILGRFAIVRKYLHDGEKMKPICHAPIPKEPWNQIMLEMQKESTLLTEAATELQQREDLLWGILGHYLYKKRWDSKHKMPIRQTADQSEAIKAYGDFWDTLIELSTQCHAKGSPCSKSYENASQWMASIVREKRSLKKNKIEDGITRKGKASLVELLRAKVKLLTEGQNPENEEITTHMFRLYKDSIRLSKSDVFRKTYWNPHIKALRAHIRQLETNPTWVSIWIEDEKCYEQTGKGRAKKLVAS